MHWRWLLGDFTPSDVRLTRAQRREVSSIAQRKYLSNRTVLLATLTVIAPVAAALKLFPLALDRLGFAGQNLPHHIGLAAVVLLVWPWSAWVYSWSYGRACRRAMRDFGRPLCVRCGYSLAGLGASGDSAPLCPECGTPTEVA